MDTLVSDGDGKCLKKGYIFIGDFLKMGGGGWIKGSCRSSINFSKLYSKRLSKNILSVT